MSMKIKRAIAIVLVTLVFVMNAGCSFTGSKTKTETKSKDTVSSIDTTSSENAKKAQDADTKVNLGTMKGTAYKNDYFGVSLNTPEGWTILSEEEKAKLMGAGAELVAGDDKTLKDKLDLSTERVLNLLYTFKYPLGAKVAFNPNFLCNAEKLSLMQGLAIRSGKDYLENSKKLLQQQQQIAYNFDKDIYSEDIGGKSFDVMEVTVKAGDTTVTQKYYSAIIKDYAFNIIISYTTDEEQKELTKTLESVKLN